MSDILNHIEKNKKETQRLVGLEYEQLQQLIQNQLCIIQMRKDIHPSPRHRCTPILLPLNNTIYHNLV
ncbi:hypothetical protein [Nostoc sp.]|uniref:hypothetical protein n=1 Tax=Nostoc sp. TaxID=1180 RepID=UPI002FFD03EF